MLHMRQSCSTLVERLGLEWQQATARPASFHALPCSHASHPASPCQANAADENTRFRGPEGITYARCVRSAACKLATLLCSSHAPAGGPSILPSHPLRCPLSHHPSSHPLNPLTSYTFKVGRKEGRVPIVLVAYEGVDGQNGGLGVFSVGTAK